MNTPTASEANVRQSRLLCEQGLWPEVLAFAQKWHAQDPTDAKALFYAGLGFSGLGQFALAESAYREALKLDDGDVKILNNLGGILFEKLNRPREGIHYIEQTLKLNPENKLGWTNLAAMVLRLGFYDKAMTYADRAIMLDANLVEAYLHKGVAARALGKTEIVRAVCEALADIRPENFHRAH